jgi:hypothetical protein
MRSPELPANLLKKLVPAAGVTPDPDRFEKIYTITARVLKIISLDGTRLRG